MCNNHEVKIHANLHDALLVLRQKRTEVPIWTDAICINQADSAEKFAQIQFMAKVYEAAQKVWAFLGNGPAGIDEAMPLLPVLCRGAKEIEQPRMPMIRRPVSQPKWEATSTTDIGIRQVADLPAPGSPFWTTIYNLVYSEYFNRLWVIQEVAFATRVEFLCGRHQISWSQMELLFGFGIQQIAGFLAPPLFPPITQNRSVFNMRKLLRNEEFGFVNHIYQTLFDMFWPWAVAVARYYLDGDDPKMQTMLRVLSEVDLSLKATYLDRMIDIVVLQECSKPEDRIFAILGLFQAKTGVKSFPWNAEQSVCEIYVETFYYLVQDDVSLKLLCMAPADPQSGLCLPSWCPSFHRHRQSGKTRIVDDTRGVNDRTWQASRRKQVISRGSDSMKLTLGGIQVSRVQVIAGSWTAIDVNNGRHTGSEIEAKVQANLECFWRIMLLDTIQTTGYQDFNLDDWLAVVQLLEWVVSPDSSFAQDSEPAQPPFVPFQPERTYQDRTPAERFIMRIDSHITYKVFFVMENGLFGMTYQGVQNGDTLCVFQGARMQHLLRHRDAGSWTFVGEAYVPGIMHGEAEQPVDGVLLETEFFVLV